MLVLFRLLPPSYTMEILILLRITQKYACLLSSLSSVLHVHLFLYRMHKKYSRIQCYDFNSALFVEPSVVNHLSTSYGKFVGTSAHTFTISIPCALSLISNIGNGLVAAGFPKRWNPRIPALGRRIVTRLHNGEKAIELVSFELTLKEVWTKA